MPLVAPLYASRIETSPDPSVTGQTEIPIGMEGFDTSESPLHSVDAAVITVASFRREAPRQLATGNYSSRTARSERDEGARAWKNVAEPVLRQSRRRRNHGLPCAIRRSNSHNSGATFEDGGDARNTERQLRAPKLCPPTRIRPRNCRYPPSIRRREFNLRAEGEMPIDTPKANSAPPNGLHRRGRQRRPDRSGPH